MGSGENPVGGVEPEQQLDLMDATGMIAVVQSVASPGCYFGDVEWRRGSRASATRARRSMVADRPDKFGAFALLPLPDVKAAIREAEYALDTLKLDGICLLTHVGSRHLGHPDDDEL